MPLSIQLGFLDVPKSITNPNVNSKDILDKDSPLSFLTFIKVISGSYEPETLQEYYNFYVKEWNTANTKSDVDDNALIVEKYRDFIKEISVNYTTPEEKKFLSLIDFNDVLDLDIAIGFYGRKLKELSEFYNEKRQNIKFNLTRNKLRGTVFGAEKTISELTLSYLKNYDDNKILYDYSDILQKLEIEIEELYDTYPLYFNQIPDPLIYDNKDLDYGYDIFLKSNTELISEIFSNMSEELKDIKEVDQLFDNKRKLTKKYITTDFYYLSTGSTTSEFISGKLFQSTFPALNLKNRYFPTTASTEMDGYLKTNRELGFFKPSKKSIILLDGINDSFSINLSTLSPNSLYYFPDPNIFGKNGEVLTFIVDDSHLKKNFSSGSAANQPKSEANDTKYYGYVSKTPPIDNKYLDSIFDSGYIKDIKSDIYGNLFGLFNTNTNTSTTSNNRSNDNQKTYRKTIETVAVTPLYNTVINGYQFYDDMYGEGYNFNYSSIDYSTYGETVRSGISSMNTGGFGEVNEDISLFFGYFTPYNDFISPTESNLTKTYRILENAFICKDDFSLYDESSSSDLSSFEFDSGPFYYTTLVDCGINSYDPIVRGLADTLYPNISSNFTQYQNISSVKIVDGGWFTDDSDFNISIQATRYQTINISDEVTEYSLSPYSNDINYALSGNIFIKNTIYKDTKSLLDTLPYLKNRYSQTVIGELSSNIIKFEVANDILFIETPSYLTINKILMVDGVFKDPKTRSILFQNNTNSFDIVTNRFKYNNDVYYAKLNTLSDTQSTNNFIIYPEIYKTDLINFENTKIFPLSPTDITNFFNISGADIRYLKCSSSTLSYNPVNNIFNISFILKDQNEMYNLHELDFKLTPDLVFLNHNIMRLKNNGYSNILDSIGTLTPIMSSSSFTFTNEELTL